MIIEISLMIIAITLIILVTFLCVTIVKVKRAVDLLQAESQQVFIETAHVLSSLNTLIKQDIHHISVESTNLLGKVCDLTDDVKGNTKPLKLLFRLLNSRSNSDSSPIGANEEKETFPQFIKLCSLSLNLIKTTKELIRNYGKK